MAIICYSVRCKIIFFSGAILIDRWHIGAWWIGFVLFGVALIVVSFLLLFFPRWIREPKWLLNRKYRNHLKLERWKKREEEARRRRRKKKKEKQRKERERRNIKNRAAQAASTSAGGNENAKSEESSKEDTATNKTKDSPETASNGIQVTKKPGKNAKSDKTNPKIGENQKKKDRSNVNDVSKSSTDNVNADGNKENGKKMHYQRKGSNSSTVLKKKSETTTATTSSIEEGKEVEDAEEAKRKKAAEKNRQRYKLGRKLQGQWKIL